MGCRLLIPLCFFHFPKNLVRMGLLPNYPLRLFPRGATAPRTLGGYPLRTVHLNIDYTRSTRLCHW
jgi:hypothetical protein